MKSTNLEIGGVYQTEFGERPYRIIGLDEVEVFYDCLSSDQSWVFSGNFRKKCYFYRTSPQLFKDKGTKIDLMPLTKEERRFFRPDLAMRIGRIKQLNWNQMAFDCYDDFLKFVNSTLSSEFKEQTIETDAIVVLPFGPNGGLKKGEKLTADNGNYFSSTELIWKSKQIQESVNKTVSEGIGLYRIGFEKELPSYYLGSYLDNAGLIKQ